MWLIVIQCRWCKSVQIVKSFTPGAEQPELPIGWLDGAFCCTKCEFDARMAAK